MSCHVDVFLMMELAAIVFNPQRGLAAASRSSKITTALVATVIGLALDTRNNIRDEFWAKYLTHAHSDALGTMGDVDSHVRTYAGVFPGSKPLPIVVKEYYGYDRWIRHAGRLYASPVCVHRDTQGYDARNNPPRVDHDVQGRYGTRILYRARNKTGDITELGCTLPMPGLQGLQFGDAH